MWSGRVLDIAFDPNDIASEESSRELPKMGTEFWYGH